MGKNIFKSTLQTKLTDRWPQQAVIIGLILLFLCLIQPVSMQANAGDLDAGFGNMGKVIMDFAGDYDSAKAIVLQPDKKIIVVGDANDEAFVALARFNADGTPDITFGSGGKVLTDTGRGVRIFEAALQNNGKIVVTGVQFNSIDPANFLLLRYNPDGTPDNTFGSGGRVITDFFHQYDFGFALAIQSDNRILVGGFAATSDQNPNFDFALARYNTDGSLDQTFGTGGKVTTDFFGAGDEAESILVQPDGKIVLAGFADNGVTDFDFALARYNPNGSLDQTFGTGGKVASDIGFDDIAKSIALQADGKIIIGGSTFTESRKKDFALLRYNSNGGLDPSFGTGGKVTMDFSGKNDEIRDLILQANGNIVVAGSSFSDSSATSADFALARYQANGSLNSSFGTGGRLLTDFSGNRDEAYAIAMQSDGKIVVAGNTETRDGTYKNFAVARYLSDPAAYDFCIQDDSNGTTLQFNSTTGNYKLSACNGFTTSGTGTLSKKGSAIKLQDEQADRRISAAIDTNTNRAAAAIHMVSPSINFTITDRNIANNTCTCR